MLKISDVLSEEEAGAQRTFRTYVNYVDALRILLGDLDQLRTLQRSLPEFASLSRRSIPIKIVERSLHRGWLNLKAMRSVPLKTYPELAFAANLWAPVQAYYSIHDVAAAVITALQQVHPQTHNEFLRKATLQFVEGLLPHPFDVTCVGYSTLPNKPKYALRGTAISEADCRRMSVLSVPTDLDAEALFVKAIVTTHDRRLEEACQRFRERKGLRRLTASQRLLCATKVSPTSIFHFLYRLRLRSNYDDPRMFLAGQTSIGDAVQHYMHLYDIALKLLTLLQEVALQVLDPRDVTELREGYRHFSKNMTPPPWPN